MTRPFVRTGLLALAFVGVPDAMAGSYSAILECAIEGQPPDLIKISGSENTPSWQHWSRSEHQWGANTCGSRESLFGFTFMYVCRFSPGAYAYSFDVVSAPGLPGDNIFTSVPRIDRMTSTYQKTRRIYEAGAIRDGETTVGTCRKAAEPVAPKPVL